MGAIEQRLNKFADDTISIIQGNMATKGRNASGATSDSLSKEVTPTKAEVLGAEYIFVVETGRKPGKRPPVDRIKSWIQSKGISIEGSIDSAAFAISKVIGERGTELFRQGGTKDIITPALDEPRIDELVGDIANIQLAETVKTVEDGIARDTSLAF